MRVVVTIAALALGSAGLGQRVKAPDESDKVLSPAFRACFLEKNAPLSAESYPCLDREYRRLDAVLTREYRRAFAGQRNDTARRRLEQNERSWWRSRFRHCKDEVGDFRGSTATVINEFCEIEALAKRIVVLRHYGPVVAGRLQPGRVESGR
jgi:uncharacterized protein YecT (DUF1311 family)